MVEDVITTSSAILSDAAPADAAAVRHLGRPVVRFSDRLWQELRVIRDFLFRTDVSCAQSVMEMRKHVTVVVEELFAFYLKKPEHLPEQWRKDIERAKDETALARLVSDYIAGMTDRFALQSHKRLLGGSGGAGERGEE